MLYFLLAAAVALWVWSKTQGGSTVIEGAASQVVKLVGFRYPSEAQKVVDVAVANGIDPRFLAALRTAENGGPGQEFGITLSGIDTYDEEVRVAANTIRNNLQRYQVYSGLSPLSPDGRYTEAFIRWFSGVFAPIGAENDPKGLNQYHAGNLLAAYREIETVMV
jgi:hypothetical protein